jgi:hypothetical protein
MPPNMPPRQRLAAACWYGERHEESLKFGDSLAFATAARTYVACIAVGWILNVGKGSLVAWTLFTFSNIATRIAGHGLSLPYWLCSESVNGR